MRCDGDGGNGGATVVRRCDGGERRDGGGQ